ncbi:hypothetical protein ACFO5X_23390 [Seohaeicola nanhaiensis]|uniref:Uncharacterized protein n=1 Tax=Seohaeicola nanhaiensis TaxID=1387282 RepID=A0ABV9KMX6_9RHOB
MANPIKITIKGSSFLGGDAPTVEDLLSQIQDLVAILRGVEDAVAEGRGEEIEWRITDATQNSPLTFEVTPFPRQHAMNVDSRAQTVIAATAVGIKKLAEGGPRPLYFSDSVISKVERVFERVTNGLMETTVDVSEYDSAPMISATKATARSALVNLHRFRAPEPISYRELGSVEGYIAKVELDGHRRPIIWLRHRLDGQMVKCVSRERGLDRIGHYEVAEVLKGLRVQVFGMIAYKDLEKISSVEVEGVHVFPEEVDLPDIGDIVAPGFTDGVEAVEYLRRLREDG